MSKFIVVNRNGDKVFDVGSEQAARLLAHHQVRPTNKNSHVLQLTGFDREHEHPCRTHTSRSALLGAIGRSQDYTIREHGRVSGFKRIFPEDLGAFRAAVLDCLRTLKLNGPVFFCDAHHGILMEAKHL